MKAMAHVARRGFRTLAVLCSLLYCSALAAEEPAADKTKRSQSETVTADPGAESGTLRARIDGFLLTRLDAIQLVASTEQLGVELSRVDEVLRSHLGLGEGKGLVVASVADEGPAAKAGIQKNDVLITVGEEEISGLDTFRKTLETSADKTLAIGLIRSGKKQSVEVTPRTIEAKETDMAFDVQQQKYWLGLGLASADDALRSQLSLPAAEGLVVTSVENDSPAAQAGVMVNDVLLQLDGKGLTAIEALSEQLQSIADKSVSLKLLRRGKPAMLTVKPVQHTEALTTFVPSFNGNYCTVGVNNQYIVNVQDPNLPVYTLPRANFIWTTPDQGLVNPYTNYGVWFPAQAEPVQQVRQIEERVKQLEAALAALRTALEAQPQPAAEGAEKK